MDLYGEPDEDDVRARMRTCLELGLEDITIGEADVTTLVGAWWTDNTVGPVPGTGKTFRLVMMTGAGYGGECIILREEDWEGDIEAYCDREENLSFQEVAEAVSSELAWRMAFGALLDLGVSIEDLIDARARAAMTRFRTELGAVCADTDGIATDPALDLPDVERAFEAFQAVCRRRMPFCAGIEVAFKDEDDVLPEVAFGHHPGAENQVLYRVWHSLSGEGFMYLNGLETDPDSYKEDIAAYHEDPWARLGALGAARDLIAIRDAAGNLVREAMRAADDQLHQELVDIHVGRHLGEPEAEEAFDLHFDTRRGRRKDAFHAVFARVAVFLDQDELHDTEPAAAAG